MSAIFAFDDDFSRKIIKYIILLSEFKLESARDLLPEFNNQNYYNHLENLLHHQHQFYSLNTHLVRYRQSNHQLQDEISSLKQKNIELSNCSSAEMTERDRDMLQTIRFLQVNELVRCKMQAQTRKLHSISQSIQEVIEYRFLKSQVSNRKQENFTKKVEVTSLQGRTIQDFIKGSKDLHKQMNDSLVTQIRSYLDHSQINEMPPHLFTREFQSLYESLITKFREIRNKLKENEYTFKDNIHKFSKRFSLQLQEEEEFETFLKNFLDCVEAEFQRLSSLKKQTPADNKDYKSQIYSDDGLSQQSNLSSSQKFFPKESRFIRKKRIQTKLSTNEAPFKSQPFQSPNLQPKLIEINDIICSQLPHLALKHFQALSASDKLDKIIKTLNSLVNQFLSEKENKGIAKPTSLLTNATPNNSSSTEVNIESYLRNGSLPQSFVRNLSDEIVIELTPQNLQENIKNLTSQLDEWKKKAQLYSSKLNERQKQNTSRIFQTSEMQNCKLTIQELHMKIASKEQQISKLQRILQEKALLISNYELKQTENKKKLDEEMQAQRSLLKKYKGLQVEFNEQAETIEKLNQMYQERFTLEIYNQNQLSKSTVFRSNEENERLKEQNKNLAAEIQRLREVLSRNPITEEIPVNLSSISAPLGEQGFLDNQSMIEDFPPFISTIRAEPSLIKRSSSFDLPPFANEQINLDKITELQHTIEIMQIQEKQKQIKNNAAIEAKNRESDKLKEQNQTLLKQMNGYIYKIKSLEAQAITHNEKNIKNLHLFPPGFIFNEFDYEERLFLLENLISYVGKIKATRLLFRADLHNRTNFHKYIDKHRHIVVIFKTVYGKLIAGYSQEAFDPNGIKKGHGMIMSLWARKMFPFREKRAISYDDYYIIFGNSQLRVKSLQFKLFSNFAIANSYYNFNGQKVHALLGEDKEREVDLAEYEVYALDLEQ